MSRRWREAAYQTNVYGTAGPLSDDTHHAQSLAVVAGGAQTQRSFVEDLDFLLALSAYNDPAHKDRLLLEYEQPVLASMMWPFPFSPDTLLYLEGAT